MNTNQAVKITTDIAAPCITILHNKLRQPNSEVAGVTYVEAQKPVSSNYLRELAQSNDYFAMPVTYHNGKFFPNRIHSYHETVGYAIISKQDVREVTKRKRLNAKESKEANSVLFHIIVESFC